MLSQRRALLTVRRRQQSMSKTTLERIEQHLEGERDRAYRVMRDSDGDPNVVGHAYDSGYWEGLAYALTTINALVVEAEEKEQ